MARTSRTSRIVAEDRAGATGLTVDGAIDSYRLSLRAGNKSPATNPGAGPGWKHRGFDDESNEDEDEAL